jgi:signal transduction histidine kinase
VSEFLRILMAGKGKMGLLSLRLKYYSWLAIFVWTGCIAVSILWNLFEHRENIHKIARNSAQVTFENDILYRKWAAKQGGVYVPITEGTPPNPYLKIPNREVTTSSGLPLTLVNPAYMARQVNQMATELHGSLGHITSLNPIRPENKPDLWEAAALKSFENGIEEVAALEKIEDKEYMRMMRPFVVEKSCLKCHAAQGYKEGDIRGGISVSVLMEPLWAIEKPHLIRMSLVHFFLWMMGILGITMSRKSLVKQVLAREGAEAALVEKTEQIEASNKELESFSYSVSHDLRVPLRAISGFSQIILKKEGKRFDEETRRRFQVIMDNAENMGRLIDDLLAFSRLGRQEVSRTDLDMDELIRDTWQELVTIHPDRKMSLTIGQMPTASGDRTLIRQVYSNLLGNAIKFTQGMNPAAIEAGCFVQKNETVYYVRDNGVGFDMKYYDKLFGVFQRLHSEEMYKGTGIGLALVQRIINRHGGRIWAESEPDKGATFYFSLRRTG